MDKVAHLHYLAREQVQMRKHTDTQSGLMTVVGELEALEDSGR